MGNFWDGETILEADQLENVSKVVIGKWHVHLFGVATVTRKRCGLMGLTKKICDLTNKK